MIVFSGDCSKEVVSQTKNLKIANKYTWKFKISIAKIVIITILGSVFLYLLSLLIWVLYDTLRYGLDGLAAFFGMLIGFPAAFLFCILLGLILGSLVRNKSILFWNFNIRIDDNSIIWDMYDEHHNAKASGNRPQKDIRVILETTLCYYIYFKNNYFNVTNVIICQKDLITLGNIDEFEHWRVTNKQ